MVSPPCSRQQRWRVAVTNVPAGGSVWMGFTSVRKKTASFPPSIASIQRSDTHYWWSVNSLWHQALARLHAAASGVCNGRKFVAASVRNAHALKEARTEAVRGCPSCTPSVRKTRQLRKACRIVGKQPQNSKIGKRTKRVLYIEWVLYNDKRETPNPSPNCFIGAVRSTSATLRSLLPTERQAIVFAGDFTPPSPPSIDNTGLIHLHHVSLPVSETAGAKSFRGVPSSLTCPQSSAACAV